MLKLVIITPEKQVFSGEADEIIAEGVEGQFGVLPQHSPLVAQLDIGELIYKKQGERLSFFINSGYAEINDDQVVILTESAECVADIEAQRVEAALQRADERVKHEEDDNIDIERARAALKRALVRQTLLHKYSGH
jgi:F-type H+-transporting ATPase subunit epsilon